MQDIKAKDVVTFRNGSLTVEDFISRWRGYHFNLNQKNKSACYKALNDQFSLVIRDVLLNREGRQLGLQDEPMVKKDVRVWQDYYLAEMVSESVELKQIKDLLDKLQNKYPIDINDELLKDIVLTDIPVIALRPGQYSSRVTPPWPSFMFEK